MFEKPNSWVLMLPVALVRKGLSPAWRCVSRGCSAGATGTLNRRVWSRSRRRWSRCCRSAAVVRMSRVLSTAGAVFGWDHEAKPSRRRGLDNRGSEKREKKTNVNMESGFLNNLGTWSSSLVIACECLTTRGSLKKWTNSCRNVSKNLTLLNNIWNLSRSFATFKSNLIQCCTLPYLKNWSLLVAQTRTEIFQTTSFKLLEGPTLHLGQTEVCS